MHPNIAVVMRGIPGSGKTTVAGMLAQSYVTRGGKIRHPYSIVSADQYFYDLDGNYNFDPSKIQEAHDVCLRRFINNAADEFVKVVVCDNTNLTCYEVDPYVRVAKAFNRKVYVMDIKCDVDVAHSRNIHGVPLESMHKMANNYEPLDDWVSMFVDKVFTIDSTNLLALVMPEL